MKKTFFALAAMAVVAASPAQAVAVYSTDFNAIAGAFGGTLQGDGSIWGVGSFSAGSPAATWGATVGNFDYLHDGNSGYRCVGNAGGCIELGGSTGYGGGGSTPPSNVGLSLTLAAGTYTISFDYARQLYGPSGFDLEVAGNAFASFPLLAATGAGVWNSYSGNFTVASAGPVSIRFLTPALGTNVGAQLDNFSVTAVPEPAAYGMALLSLAGLGLVARRRRES